MGWTALLVVAAVTGSVGAEGTLPATGSPGATFRGLGDPVRVAHDPVFHTALDHTIPADGDTLSTGPEEVELVFTGPIETERTSVTLVRPDGTSSDLVTTVTGEERPIVTASLPVLSRGAYRVTWRVISPDGHPLDGSFVFYVEGPVESSAAPAASGPRDAFRSDGPEAAGGGTAARPGGEDDEAAVTEEGGYADGRDRPDTPFAIPPRADGAAPSESGTTVGLIGTTAGINLTLLALAGLLGFAAWGPIAPRASTLRTALLLAIGAAVLAPGHAWLWTTQVLAGDPGLGDRLNALTGLTTGRAVGLRLVLVWLALGTFALSRRTPVAAVLAGLAVLAGALGGHPAAYSPALAQPANALHLLAASAWMGGLVFILTERSSMRHTAVIRRVSTVALVSVVFVALAGMLQAWLFMGSASELLETTYGRLVLAKGAGLLALIGFGAVHRLRLIPAMEEKDRTEPILRAVRFELLIAGSVLVVASILAHVSPVAS